MYIKSVIYDLLNFINIVWQIDYYTSIKSYYFNLPAKTIIQTSLIYRLKCHTININEQKITTTTIYITPTTTTKQQQQ